MLHQHFCLKTEQKSFLDLRCKIKGKKSNLRTNPVKSCFKRAEMLPNLQFRKSNSSTFLCTPAQKTTILTLAWVTNSFQLLGIEANHSMADRVFGRNSENCWLTTVVIFWWHTTVTKNKHKTPPKNQNSNKTKKKKNLGKGRKESKNLCNWHCFLETALI